MYLLYVVVAAAADSVLVSLGGSRILVTLAPAKATSCSRVQDRWALTRGPLG